VQNREKANENWKNSLKKNTAEAAEAAEAAETEQQEAEEEEEI